MPLFRRDKSLRKGACREFSKTSYFTVSSVGLLLALAGCTNATTDEGQTAGQSHPTVNSSGEGTPTVMSPPPLPIGSFTVTSGGERQPARHASIGSLGDLRTDGGEVVPLDMADRLTIHSWLDDPAPLLRVAESPTCQLGADAPYVELVLRRSGNRPVTITLCKEDITRVHGGNTLYRILDKLR